MNINELKRLFDDTAYIHRSGTEEEKRAAEYLRDRCEELGVKAWLEAFDVPMGEIESASLVADGNDIPCKALFCCGSGTVEGQLYYMPATDPVSIAGAKGKIVLMDGQGVDKFTYKELVRCGAKGLIFQAGNMYQGNEDIELRDLRASAVGEEKKLLSVMVHSSRAVELVKSGCEKLSITVNQREYTGKSHNVVAELPGQRAEYITLTAHYDTTGLSQGAYDNMSGCAGLLAVMEALKNVELNYGLRFVFCGSEERGLLGSKAYVAAHEEQLESTVLNINLDMIGSIMGKFIACVSAEDKLSNYVSYMGAELGFAVSSKCGVYSSDSTSFADKGVPAISLARIAGGNVAPIHCRFDTVELLSMPQLLKDIAFITEFTRRMACAVICPVSRNIPDNIKKELDEYLFRKKKEQ